MKKAIIDFMLLFALCVYSNAEVIEKGSNTDKAVAAAIEKGTVAAQEVINESLNVIKNSKDFVVEEAPKVVKEYLKWKFAVSIFWICFGVFILLFFSILGTVWLKSQDPDFNLFGFLSVFISLIWGLPVIFTNVYELIYIVFAPRIYLIQHLVELVKNGNM
jgi:hypothetical protein